MSIIFKIALWTLGVVLLVIPLLIVILSKLAGPPKETPPATLQSRPAEPIKPVVAAPPAKPAPNYVMRDGMQYGYPALRSADDQARGLVAPKVVMAFYAGERDGKHQVHLKDGVMVEAIECDSPCQYAKVMTYLDNEYLKEQIKVERIKAEPGTMAAAIMADALNGHLRTYGVEFNGVKHNAWVDEKLGMRYTPIKAVAKAAQK